MNTYIKSTDNTMTQRKKGQLDQQWSQNTAQKTKQQAKNLTKKTNIGLLFPITFTYNNLLYYIWLCFLILVDRSWRYWNTWSIHD
jgi:hypothetical protein